MSELGNELTVGGAAAFGVALGVGKPIAEAAAQCLRNLAEQPCKVAGELIADQFYAFQWANRLRILARVEKKIADRKLDRRTLPAGFLMPLLDACGNSDDPLLQDLWSELIANSLLNEDCQHPLHIECLKRMSVRDAIAFLEVCVGVLEESAGEEDAAGNRTRTIHYSAAGTGMPWNPPSGRDDLVSPLHHLITLGLVERIGSVSYGTSSELLPRVAVTAFGVEFWAAIGSPAELPEAGSSAAQAN